MLTILFNQGRSAALAAYGSGAKKKRMAPNMQAEKARQKQRMDDLEMLEVVAMLIHSSR